MYHFICIQTNYFIANDYLIQTNEFVSCSRLDRFIRVQERYIEDTDLFGDGVAVRLFGHNQNSVVDGHCIFEEENSY